MSETQHKVHAIEGLRALMAWWVVFGHVAHGLGPGVPVISAVLRANTLAVEVFIVISGFVIARLVTVKREPFMAYLARRALRIFPLYLLGLAVSAALLPVFLDALQDTPFQNERTALRIVQVRAALADLPAHLAVHVPLLQGLIPAWLLPHAPFTIVGQAWSVSLEWQFYLIAPVFVLAAFRFRLFCGLVLALALLGGLPYMSPAFIGQSGHGFLLGALSYRLMQADTARLRWWICGLIAVTLGLGVLLAGPKPLVAALIWGVVLASILTAGRIARWLSHPVLVQLGTQSYSVYILHMIPLLLGTAMLNGLGLSGTSYAVALYLVTVGATWILSRLSWHWVEQPCIALGRKLEFRRAPARAPAQETVLP